MDCLDENSVALLFERGGSDPRIDDHADTCESCRRLIASISRWYVSGQGEDTLEAEARAPVSLANASTGALAGSLVGRYRIEKVLGVGGMGVVYAAHDPLLRRRIALKLLRAGRESPAKEDLLREAQVLAGVQHPNIVAIHDVGEHGDGIFLALELFEGTTVTQWRKSGRRSWREVVRVFLQAGAGLEAAHARQIIHRDFKPDNVLINDEGQVRVTDFGLARMLPELGASGPVVAGEPAQRSTRAGTPAYMAPEQHEGSCDARTDQFNFCVALYECLYGERPFHGGSLTELKDAVDSGRIRTPDNAAVPAWLRKIVLRGLSPKPEDRHRSLAELLHALKVGPWWRSRAVQMSAAGMALCAVGALAFHARSQSSQLCHGSAQQVASVWGAAERSTVEKAFRASKLPFAVDSWSRADAALSAYAADWARMHTDACEATRIRGEQSDQLLSLRMVCLQRRLVELKALANVLASGNDSTVEKAVDAARALTPVSACADVGALLAVVPPPSDPADAQRVRELEPKLASAKAWLDADSLERARPAVESVVNGARSAHHRPTEAEALFLLGTLQRKEIHYADAEKALLDAVSAAEAGGDDRRAVITWTTLALLSGYDLGKHELGRLYVQRASASLERMGGEPLLEAGILRAAAGLDGAQGKFTEELGKQERALALYRRALPPGSLDIARAEVGLGGALLSVRRNAEAIEVLHHAVEDLEQAQGREHPDVSLALSNLSVAQQNEGRMDEALSALNRALAITLASRGPEHPQLAIVLANRSSILMSQGQPEAALTDIQRALEIRLKEVGAEHEQVGILRIHEANALSALGQKRQALVAAKEGGRILEARLGREHPFVGQALSSRGAFELSLGKSSEAVASFSRADEILSHAEGNSAWRTENQFKLARALWTLGRGSRPRAVAIAQTAARGFRELGSAGDARREEVEEWLRAHR